MPLSTEKAKPLDGIKIWDEGPKQTQIYTTFSNLSVCGRQRIRKTSARMPEGISGSFSSPKVDFMVDMGNPFLNLAVDGFLKIGAVATAKVAAEETYDILIRQGTFTSQKFDYSLRRMCREGACWGAVAGVYVGMEYGVERIRGTKDWKNALISGALTGAIVSAASNRNRDSIVMDAIAGGAVATAAEFIGYLT